MAACPAGDHDLDDDAGPDHDPADQRGPNSTAIEPTSTTAASSAEVLGTEQRPATALARTGTDSSPVAAVGFGLLVGGIGLARAGTRRRSA